MKVTLMTKELRRKLPPLYSREDEGLEALALVKYFTPDSSWTWYGTEFDGKDIFFGAAAGHVLELGNFSLSELEKVRGPLGLYIERDRHFQPISLRQIGAMWKKRGLQVAYM